MNTKQLILRRFFLWIFPVLLLAIAALLGWRWYSEKQYTQWKIEKYLQHPLPGDILVIKTTSQTGCDYTLLKIKESKGGQVTYIPSQFYFSTFEGAQDQILDPQTDQGQAEVTIAQEKLSSLPIVNIFGQKNR